MTTQEKQYFAGVFDAGLKCQVRPDKGLHVHLYTRYEALALLLKEKFGGSVCPVSKGWRWSLYDSLAIRDALASVDPYMKVKRQQVQAVGAEADRRYRNDGRLKHPRVGF